MKGDFFTDSYSVSARWGNYSFQLLNVHGVHDVRQTEIHIVGLLESEPSAFEFEMATEKLKKTQITTY